MKSALRTMSRLPGRRYKTMEETIAAAYNDNTSGAEGPDRHTTQLQFSIDNRKPGSLFDILQPFKDHEINFTSITTRQSPDQQNLSAVTVFADIDGHIDDPSVKRALDAVRKQALHYQLIQSCTTPWYATNIADIDKFAVETLAAGGELTSDHPGFSDPEYRQRRDMIANIAKKFKHGDKIATIPYTKDENKTWGVVWERLMELYPTHACREFNYNFTLMVENCGYRPDQIPQLEVCPLFFCFV